MNTKLLSVLTMLLLILGSESIMAQCVEDADGNLVNPLTGGPCNNVITTAVPFLRISPDARSAAMGDAGIALGTENGNLTNALHFNDSRLAFAERNSSVTATYTPWLRNLGLNDVYMAHVAYYTKLDGENDQAIGASLRYFNFGSIELTNQNGDPLGDIRPNEFEFKLAYARKLGPNFSAGLGGKLIYSNLATGFDDGSKPGVAGAADLSFTYKGDLNSSTSLAAGLAITNIGTKIAYSDRDTDNDFIPTNLGIGAALDYTIDDYNSVSFALDINKLLVPTPPLDTSSQAIDNYKAQSVVSGIFGSFSDAPGGGSEELREFMISFGAEYWYDDQFAVRAGYFWEHDTKGARKYFTAGLGLKYQFMGLDFSYLVPTSNQRSPLDNTLRFSLIFDIGAGDGFTATEVN